jgi:hypothetical protein
MTLEITQELLGLGSIVRLENEKATGLYVVLARGAFRPDKERNQVVPRYLVGPHPYGEAPDRETFPVLATEIQTVVHYGYTDAADTEFVTDLLDQMENGRRETKRAEQFTDALTLIPDAVVDADSDGSHRGSEDPFFELRMLVGKEDRRQAP